MWLWERESDREENWKGIEKDYDKESRVKKGRSVGEKEEKSRTGKRLEWYKRKKVLKN